jgi:hypothetical protein
MRSNSIKCDVCKKEHDAEYMLPSEWVTTTQNTIHGTQEEHHFCGKTPCLVAWATGAPMSIGDQVMFGGPSL